MNEATAYETMDGFVKEMLTPHAAAVDSDTLLLRRLVSDAGRLGLLGLHFPVECGGAGLEPIVFIHFVKEVAKANASLAMTLVAHSMLSCFLLARFANQPQREKHLRHMITGERLGAFALTEPGSGSDIASIRTSAIKREGGYVVTGHKAFITNANIADYFIVIAKTDRKSVMGLSVFVVEKSTPGIRVTGEHSSKLGMKGADTGEIFINDAFVPDSCLIGNFGMRAVLETLTHARLGMAAVALGIAEAAKAASWKYARERIQFGLPLYRHQSISNKLADMEVETTAAELLLDKAVHAASRGEDVLLLASVAKLYASEMANRVAKDAVQIHGANGCSSEYPLERYFRDAKITEIADGTSEILRDIITGRVLKARNLESGKT